MKRVVSICLVVAMLVLGVAACNKVETDNVSIGVLKGPTAIGAVKLIEDDSAYESVTVIAAAEDMSAKFIQGEVDIAAVPTNLAAVLYNKTDGDVQLLAINTLGVLYILSSDSSIQSVADLKGRTIVTSGQGSVPEYALNYILEQNGLIPGENVTVEYKQEHTEVAALAVSGAADIVMVPEPFVTSILTKSDSMQVAIDVTKAWEDTENGAPLAMGCIIAHKDTDKAVIDAFLKDYKASTEFANSNIDETAKIIGDAGILDEAVVKQAIPRCNIVCQTGAEMKETMQNFLTVLFEENPQSVGGTLPGEDFYYAE